MLLCAIRLWLRCLPFGSSRTCQIARRISARSPSLLFVRLTRGESGGRVTHGWRCVVVSCVLPAVSPLTRSRAVCSLLCSALLSRVPSASCRSLSSPAAWPCMPPAPPPEHSMPARRERISDGTHNTDADRRPTPPLTNGAAATMQRGTAQHQTGDTRQAHDDSEATSSSTAAPSRLVELRRLHGTIRLQRDCIVV